MFKLPEKIEYVLNHFADNGYEAFLVGGCVRDMLMGKTPNDYDIATSATPDEIIGIFEKTIPTGIKHGTVTILLGNEPIEVTTFRCDGDYNDLRHPSNVKFVRNIEDDLSRRDFTVNAIAYNPVVGIIDIFGGKEDINSRILRAVGDPEKRFSEDALRIIRLFRFASVMNFEIEEKTLAAALLKAATLSTVSIERLHSELCKLLCGEKPEIITSLIENNGLSHLKINQITNPQMLKNLPQNIGIRLFAFLNLTEVEFNSFFDKFKASNQLKNEVLTFKKLSSLPTTTKEDLKELLNVASPYQIEDFLSYKTIFLGYDTTHKKELLKEIISNKEPYKISHLALNGNDLKDIGIKGEKTGEYLEILRNFVIYNPQSNTKEKLLQKLNNYRN